MKVAIVNDALAAVEALRRAVSGTGQHSVAWVAHDGASAVGLCAKERPDVVLMDLFMPVMDGVEATRRIMARTPCPIVVVTADVDRHHARVFQAMGAGALDAVNTPAASTPEAAEGAKALLAKIETIRRLIGAPTAHVAPLPPVLRPSPTAGRGQYLVAIGASAGGPTALARVLSQWPAEFPAAILVVQHMDARFTASLAPWLASQTRLTVRLAREGERPQAGTVLLAGADQHLVFGSPTRLVYSTRPANAAFRPSVDVLFESIATHWPGDAIGVLLTGMGRDGAAGLKLLREAGHYTIAQDEATSAVYGMPRAAGELGAAREVLPLGRIAPRIAMILARKSDA